MHAQAKLVSETETIVGGFQRERAEKEAESGAEHGPAPADPPRRSEGQRRVFHAFSDAVPLMIAV
jgi:hypothetical protein